MVQPSILKSHKHYKMIETHFNRLYSIMTGSNIIKSMTTNFLVVGSDLLPICCRLGWDMPYLCFFVEEVVMLLGAITDKRV